MSRALATHPEGCLFCRRHDGGFTSEEHIISSRLGNVEHVLQPGVVCDRCNNGPLARADRAITDFEPITLLRSERGLSTRSGQGVISRFKEADIAFTGPRELSVFRSGPSPVEQVGPYRYRIPMTTTSPFKSQRGLSMLRSMWKTVIEFIYLDHGHKAAYSSVLDPARREVIGNGDGHGWVVLPKTCRMRDEVSTTYRPVIIEGRLAFPMLLDVFGVRLYSDLVRRFLTNDDIERTLPAPANVWVFPKQRAPTASRVA